MNIEFDPRDLKKYSTNILQTCSEVIVDELVSRYGQSELDEKQKIFSIILKLKSRLTLLESEILRKTIDPSKATPWTGNQISIGLKLKEFHDAPAKDKEFLDKFIESFWKTCQCSQNCYTKVPFDQAFLIYQEYSEVNDNEKFDAVGAVLRNIKTDPSSKINSGQRNRYQYRVAGVKLCASFFQLLYHLTKKQLERLQRCITHDHSLRNIF